MMRAIEDIQKSCCRFLEIIRESGGDGATVMLNPFNLSLAPCPAALAIEDTEFAVGEAPIMPLPSCISSEQCVCVYGIRRLQIE